MKLKVVLTTPFGVFESDESEISKEEEFEVDKISENFHKLLKLSIEKDGETRFFPEEVLRKSFLTIIKK